MASYMKVTRVFYSVARLRQTQNLGRWQKCGIKGSFLIGGFFGIPKESKEIRKELPKLEEADPSKLSREYLIQSATVKTSEEVGTLVLHTALALIQAEKEYHEAVFALVVLMEYKLKVLDNETETERIWDLILQGRELVNRTKTKKRTLEMIFINSKNMLSSAAEVAYMTGAEFAGDLAGNRVYKIEQHLKQVQTDSEEVETKLRKVEAKTIEVESDNESNAEGVPKSEPITVIETPQSEDKITSDTKNGNINPESENDGKLSSFGKEPVHVIDSDGRRDLLEDNSDSVKDISETFVEDIDICQDELTDNSKPSDNKKEDLKF